jgi:prevent-host-death family protein
MKKRLTNVVSRDYIARMKKMARTVNYSEHKPSASVLKDAVALPGVGLTIPVRAAKAKLSALLELVAGGQEVTITSDGKPKAVLLPVGQAASRKVFTGTLGQLRKMPLQTEGPFAEEILRADRDGRGW